MVSPSICALRAVVNDFPEEVRNILHNLYGLVDLLHDLIS